MKLSKANKPSHWILLRGLAREARHWGTLPSELEAALNSGSVKGSRVDTIDLPGAGRYSEMRSPMSVSEIAEFVREKFIEARRRIRESGAEPPSQVCLVAVSLGGMVACEWLTEWPGDLTACVLVNTSFKGYSSGRRRLNPSTLPHFRRIFTAPSGLEREKAILRMISNRPETHEQIANAWHEISLSRPFARQNFFRQMFAAARFVPRLSMPPVPVLIVSSQRDRMVHHSCSAEIARRWNAEHRIHETAGHDLPLDEPEWMIQQLVDWWR